MKYPKFLDKNDKIGITALSMGINNEIKDMKISLNHLKKDYHLVITPNVYNDGFVSSDIKVRLQELNEYRWLLLFVPRT